MRGGGVKPHLHESFQRHPFVVVIDLPAPGAHAHELFQIVDAFQNPARRGAHQEPDGEHQEDFQRGPSVNKSEGMAGEDQGRQLEQLIQIADRHDGQKTEVLIQHDSRQLRILFHRSKDDSRMVICAQKFTHSNRIYYPQITALNTPAIRMPKTRRRRFFYAGQAHERDKSMIKNCQ